MRVDAQSLAHGRHFNAFFAPLKRANGPLQAAQGNHGCLPVGRAKGLQAGLFGIRGAPQIRAVIGIQLNQDLAQDAGALGLRLAVSMKYCTGDHGGIRVLLFDADFFGFVDAPSQCLEQLTGVLKITAPQQARAGAGQPVGSVSGHGVVGQHHMLGQHLVRSPEGRAWAVFFKPVQKGGGVHAQVQSGLVFRAACHEGLF